MAAVSHMGKKVTVHEVRKEYLPSAKEDADKKTQFITDIISSFINQHHRPLTRIVLALPGESIIFRTMVLPYLSKHELASAVAFEAQLLLPYAVEESYYDYRTTTLIESDEQKRYKLSLHASHKHHIDEALSYFRKINRLPVRVYHAQDSIGQLLRSLDDFNHEKSYTLINIGHHTTAISFYRGANLEFSHATQVSSSMMGAQKNKATYEYFAETISSEIQNSLDYYSGQISGDYNPNVFVYGDFAYSEELLSLLNNIGSVQLEIFPINKLKINHSSEEFSPVDYAVCLTALSAALNGRELANLLPPFETDILKEQRQTSYAQVTAATVLLACGLSWGVINENAQQQKDSVRELQKQVDVFTHSDSYHMYNAIKREILFNQAFMDKIKNEPSYFGLNLKELSRVAPYAVKLFNLELNQDEPQYNVHLQGVVRSVKIPPEVILAEFIENLNASPFYNDVQIVRHIKKQTSKGFEVEFLLKMNGVV